MSRLGHGLREAREIVRETLEAWQDDGAVQWGAALAYYATLSLPPLVLLLLAGAGRIHGDEAARVELLSWSGRAFGPQGRAATRTIMENSPESVGVLGTGSAVLLLLVATGVFAQLQKAMNEIWDVEWPGGGVERFLRARGLGFLVVLVLGVLFAAAVTASTAIALVAPYLRQLVPGARLLLLVGNAGFSFAVVALLFAALFRVLPDVRISWRDVWVGAGVSALLFLVGNAALGLYLRVSTVGSAYGAAGSLLGLLVWIYYSAQVYFFGAEFTQVWARRYGGAIEPARGAVAKPR